MAPNYLLCLSRCDAYAQRWLVNVLYDQVDSSLHWLFGGIDMIGRIRGRFPGPEKARRGGEINVLILER